MSPNFPAPSVTPGLLYHNAPEAIDWLCRAFGFDKRLVIPGQGNTILHAHLTIEGGGVMISSAEDYAFPDLCTTPKACGGVGTVEIVVRVNDADAHHARAVAAGARIISPPADKPYGGRGYTAKDPEGHVWAFGTYDAWADS